MAKFNKTKEVTLTENLAGGKAYNQSNELSLVSILLTSFVNDQFYRDTKSTLGDLKNLMNKVDPEFAAKACIYARDKFGMRSISHVLAAELASKISGFEWSKNFYDKVVVRVDDMSEIMAYYLLYKTSKDHPKFPNSLKKGFSKAFNRFDNYQISKYRCENKEVKLIDIINLIHPTPSERNKESIEKLVKGELKNTETWESKLSKTGQIAENEEDLANLKSEAWNELLSSRKLGYFALLKNLKNIINQSPSSVDLACDMLVDEKMISKSRVLPFRFVTAYEEISKLDSSKITRDVLTALNNALNISVCNVPKLDGETLVVMDVSGSMRGKPSEIASLFGAILAKSNNCDVMTFATDAQYKKYNPFDSVLTIRQSFIYSGGGTNFKSIFLRANKKYDNIIILSDCQGWVGHTTPSNEFNDYKNNYKANPHVFSWDLAGLGTLQFPENYVFALAGFSDKVFDILNLLKEDKKALINEINSIEL